MNCCCSLSPVQLGYTVASAWAVVGGRPEAEDEAGCCWSLGEGWQVCSPSQLLGLGGRAAVSLQLDNIIGLRGRNIRVFTPLYKRSPLNTPKLPPRRIEWILFFAWILNWLPLVWDLTLSDVLPILKVESPKMTQVPTHQSSKLRLELILIGNLMSAAWCCSKWVWAVQGGPPFPSEAFWCWRIPA